MLLNINSSSLNFPSLITNSYNLSIFSSIGLSKQLITNLLNSLLGNLFSLYLFIVFYNMIIRYCNATSNKKRYLILGILALIVGVLLIFNPGGMILIYLKVIVKS